MTEPKTTPIRIEPLNPAHLARLVQDAPVEQLSRFQGFLIGEWLSSVEQRFPDLLPSRSPRCLLALDGDRAVGHETHPEMKGLGPRIGRVRRKGDRLRWRRGRGGHRRERLGQGHPGLGEELASLMPSHALRGVREQPDVVVVGAPGRVNVAELAPGASPSAAASRVSVSMAPTPDGSGPSCGIGPPLVSHCAYPLASSDAARSSTTGAPGNCVGSSTTGAPGNCVGSSTTGTSEVSSIKTRAVGSRHPTDRLFTP